MTSPMQNPPNPPTPPGPKPPPPAPIKPKPIQKVTKLADTFPGLVSQKGYIVGACVFLARKVYTLWLKIAAFLGCYKPKPLKPPTPVPKNPPDPNIEQKLKKLSEDEAKKERKIESDQLLKKFHVFPNEKQDKIYAEIGKKAGYVAGEFFSSWATVGKNRVKDDFSLLIDYLKKHEEK